MTNEQLKELEAKLWDSANALRASGGIKASDYAVPVLGLIFLKFADNKYSQFEEQIEQEYKKDKGSRMERPIEEIAIAKCGLYLPENARFKYLLNLPVKESMATALKAAMEGIEKHQDEKFQEVLPKDAYFNIEKKDKKILPDLLKTFSDIPEDSTGDIFGKIYEYFLGKFALSEGQKGGEFFTPTSVVRFIVEVIEPYKGKLFDPACGSGGMFVQSATFVRRVNHDLSDIYVCGQEHMGETVRLAKMNLLVNQIRGEIAEVNSYANDPFESFEKFDYVMANPPFNVKSVKESTVINDQRFTQYGLPKNKGKKDDKITDANYLWISLFASSLNSTGRAGFVMANSASDARNSEYEIRKKIVDSGIVDCMVSMPSNMFFTVTLPATLWFFDKQKVNTDRKDKILFLDARNVYNQIDRAHREWTEEQQQNLAAIVRLYRGETNRYLELIEEYCNNAIDASSLLEKPLKEFSDKLQAIAQNLKTYKKQSAEKRNEKDQQKLNKSKLSGLIDNLSLKEQTFPKFNGKSAKDNAAQLVFAKELIAFLDQLEEIDNTLKQQKDQLVDVWTHADKHLKIKQDKNWGGLELTGVAKALDELQQIWTSALEKANYWHQNMHWLQKRFPEAKYKDITGLCKAADKTDYIDEQDYSLNAGRYVGVEFEDDRISEEEFKEKLTNLHQGFMNLTNESTRLEKLIAESFNNFNL